MTTEHLMQLTDVEESEDRQTNPIISSCWYVQVLERITTL